MDDGLGSDVTRSTRGIRVQGHLDINKLMLFAFGVLYLGTITGLAIYNQDIGAELWQVIKTGMALAAAGIGASFPGTVIVKVSKWIRAGGALALFVIVYFFSAATVPGKIQSATGLAVRPTTEARPPAEQWLKVLDAGDYRAAWGAMSSAAKASYPLDDFVALSQSVRQPLGKLQSRTLVGSQSLLNPPGMPAGHYQMFRWNSSFDQAPRHAEFISLVPEQGAWRVYSYNVTPLNQSGGLP